MRLDGETIVTSSVNAEFDACRVLKARGLHGRIGFRHHGSQVIGIVTTIDRGAELTIEEDATGRVRFRKWRPYEPGQKVRSAAHWRGL